MAFDANWFDELRSLSTSCLAGVPPSDGFAPKVRDVRRAGLVSQPFVQALDDLVRQLARSRYPFDPQFRVYERHLFDFPSGKSFRKQWSIGFYAGDLPDGDCVRLGIGFRLNQNFNPTGITEFGDWLVKVTANPRGFDTVFASLGNGAEPAQLSTHVPFSAGVLADRPDLADDWRFYGRILRRVQPADWLILQSVPEVVREAVSVFDTITQGGFN